MTSNLVLEGEILLIVFAEVHGFGPMGNALAGIVAKAHTALVIVSNAPLSTEDRSIIQLRTEGTIGTGFLDFFSEEHMLRLFSHDV